MTSTLPPDPWKVLGVDKAADKSDIRAAYKKLVLKCHPDKVQDPTLKAKKQEEFQKVQQAYELLNDDAERAKYEQKQKLADLQRAAAKVQHEARNSPNTSVPRTSTRYATFDIRTAEPTSRYTSSPSGGKVYTHYTTTHTRSHEEVPSSRVYTLYEETDKQARRTASYEKPSKKDEERRDRDREERKRRKEEEEFNRIRERDRAYEREKDKERERVKAEYEKDRERDARKAEKKRLDKERERERRRETEDKARRHKPYVEPYADAYADVYLDELWLEDEKYVSARSDKKRSSSRKHDETREREREKSSSRRAKSPHLNPDSLDRKGRDNQSYAAAYIMLSKSQTSQSSYLPHPAPTPPPAPPVDFVEEDSLRHAAARAAGRRSSNDAARSREKLRTYDLDPATPISTTPKSARPIPTLKQSYSTPPTAPESPPRVSRSQTVPHDLYTRPVPSLQRNQTWAAGSGGGLAGMEDRRAADYYDDYDNYDSDDDRDRRHRRSGRDRRARSPSAQVAAAAATQRYKVEGGKTSKLDSYPSVYGGSGESPTSRRYAAATAAATGGVSPGVVGGMEGGMSPSATTTYQGTPFRVKEAKSYGPADVKYSEYAQPSYYASHGGEGYPVMA